MNEEYRVSYDIVAYHHSLRHHPIPVYATPALFCRRYLVTISNINAVHTVSAPPAVLITEAVVHIVQRTMGE